MSKTYSKPIFQVIQNHLSKHKLRFFPLEEDGVIVFDMRFGHTVSSLDYEILVGENAFTAYVLYPLTANPKNHKAMRKVAEYVNRINYNIRCGCFEFDYDDGSIRYKIYVDCRDTLPGDGILERVVAIPYMMFKKYAEGIPMILYTDADPQELYEAASSEEEDHDESADAFDEDMDDEDDTEGAGDPSLGSGQDLEWDPSIEIPTVEQMLGMMGNEKNDASDEENEDSQGSLTEEEIHDQFAALYGLLGDNGHPSEQEAEEDGVGNPGDAAGDGPAE